MTRDAETDCFFVFFCVSSILFAPRKASEQRIIETRETRVNGFKIAILIGCLGYVTVLTGCGGGGGETKNILQPSVLTHRARLTNQSSHLADGRYAVIYRFVSNYTGSVKISMSSTEIKSSLWAQTKTNSHLENIPSETLVSPADQSGKITLRLDVISGKTYFVTASSTEPRMEGDYALTYPTELQLDGFEIQTFD